MKKRILSILLILALLVPVLAEILPVHAQTAPAVAVYVNGNWVAAQNLTGSGETWVCVPIDKASLVENNTNYVRITTNVASGTSQDTQASLYFTGSAWSNTFLTPNWWVDDGWQAFSDKQANFYIAGWNGASWQRIHDDIDTGYKTDSASVLGRNADGTYTNFARNIWVGDNTLEKYTNYCIMIHMNLGTQLATNTENAALFPSQNYHTCALCNDCGGCTASDCALHHEKCTCGGEHSCTFCETCGKCKDNGCGCEHEKCNGDAAIRLRLNGQWYGIYVNDLLDQDEQWVSIPVSMDGLVSGGNYQLAASSNVVNGGNLTDTSVDFYATNAEDGFESFLTNDRYCDGGWAGYSDRNVNLKLEGWNGHEWVDLNVAKPTYSADQTTVLGQFSDGTWFNPCRNITLGDLTGITAMRASVQLHIGKTLSVQSDFIEENFAIFPEPQKVEAHEMCAQHPDSCSVVGCLYNTCAALHHCTFCEICGKCVDTDCGCEHEKCAMDENAALRVRVNQYWYGLNISEQAGTHWVYVPVDITKLNQDGENYLSLSSNVSSQVEGSAHSLDVLFSETESGDTFFTDHRWCDENWTELTGKNVNMMLQLYDGTQWVNAKEETYETGLRSVLGLSQTEEKWYNYSRTLTLGDLTQYSAARVAVQIHVGERLDVIEDYTIEQFATFLNTGLAASEPTSDKDDPVVVHSLKAAAPSAPATGTSAGRENAHLRVRFNGTWYETALDSVKTDENGMAWVSVDVPVAQLRANAENQVLLSSDVSAAGAYSGSSVDLYATATTGANSFINVNDYYDDWTRNESAEWNIRLEASRDGKTWESLTGSNPTYCDASYQLGRRSDGSKSHAAKNLFLSEISEYQYARLVVQVHIGTHLVSRSEHTATAPTPAAAQNSGNGGTPKLWVRVNGTWSWINLSEYLGTNGGWITCPIDINLLRDGEENYFGLTTNVVSYGDFTDSSVDFYATCVEDGFNSFLTNDPYSDNDFAQYQDRNINLVLELYDGSKWVSVPSGETHTYDEHTVLGLFADNQTWYNAARNLILGDLSGYSDARIRVQMHIGTSLTVQENTYVAGGSATPVSHNTSIPEEKPSVKEVKDNEDVKLRIRVNGSWFEASLQPYKGQTAVWVPVEIDLSALRGGEENYFHVSTTAISYGSHTANSVDLYYSNANKDLNSFLCADEYCDNGWVRYHDRNFNIRLELFDGSHWVTAAPVETTYYDGSVPIGYLGEENDWSNAARNIMVGSLDGYSAARVLVELHVGSALAGLDDEEIEASTDVDRGADVGKPAYADVKRVDPADKTDLPQDTDTAAEKETSSLTWLWIALGGAATVILACLVLLRIGRKGTKKVKK